MWPCVSPAVPTTFSLLPAAFFASNIWPQLLSLFSLHFLPLWVSWSSSPPPGSLNSCSEMLYKLSHSSLPPAALLPLTRGF